MNVNDIIKNNLNDINKIISNEAVNIKESVLYCDLLFNNIIKNNLNINALSIENLHKKIRELDATKYTELLKKAKQLSYDIEYCKCTDYPSSVLFYLKTIEFNETLNEIYKE